MTGFDLFEGIGNLDDDLVEKVAKSNFKRSSRKFPLFSGLAICAMIAVCILIARPFDKVQQMIINEADGSMENLAEIGESKANLLLPLEGTLKEVSEKELKSYVKYFSFGFLDEIKEKHYYLSYLDSGEIAYGAIDVGESKDQLFRVYITPKKVMDDSMEKVKMLQVGNFSIDIYKSVGNPVAYCTSIGKFEFYSIMENDREEKQFMELLEKIFDN
ncbi:hypothetical protein P261_01441 [Lachnospiraceae bacterium TWA4]|nr:hypothetical protein P261_01441 [Lachnospiraceae bacterium TWA4]